MPNDDNPNAELTAEQIAGQITPSTDAPSTDVTTTQPSTVQPEPAWRQKYQTPEKMWDENRKFMSEAEKYRRENETLRRQIPQPQVDPREQAERFVERLISEGPKAIQDIVSEATLPLRAEVALGRFEAAYPDAKKYNGVMRDLLEADPKMAETKNGLMALYLLAREEDKNEKSMQAQQVQTDNRAAVQQAKQTDAYVEPASQPQRQSAPKLKPGMSIEESIKALRDSGIGDAPEDPYSGT